MHSCSYKTHNFHASLATRYKEHSLVQGSLAVGSMELGNTKKKKSRDGVEVGRKRVEYQGGKNAFLNAILG